MRILFFCNSPVSAIKLKNKNFIGESWILAIEKKLKECVGIELGFAFQDSVKKIEHFEIENVKYFACPNTSGFKKRKIGWGGKYETNDKKGIENYLSIIDIFKPDIIQIFGTENNYGLLGNYTKTPIIIHIQGFIGLCYKNYFSGTSFEEVKKSYSNLSILKGDTPVNEYLFFKQTKDREQFIYENNKYFIGRTDFDRRLVSVLAPNAKYFRCEEMLRDNFFKYRWEKPNNEVFYITSIIRPSFFKGIDIIIEASKVLNKLKVKFKWNVIGTASDHVIVDFFKKKFKEETLENINFLGNKSEDEIIKILLDSNVYMHPSYVENSPNSVCEAMLLGIPVIAANTGGMSSMFIHDKEGILVNVGDPFDTAGAIIELNNNPENSVKMGLAARKRALSRHNPESIIKNLLKIYKSVTNKDTII